MFTLNREERKACVTLIVFAFVGVIVRFGVQTSKRVEQVVTVPRSIVQFDANLVTFEELMRSRVVSRRVAERLIQFRNQNGPFREFDDLSSIPGVGPQRLQKLKTILYVD